MDAADAVYDLVRTVPAGKVVTYGQAAEMAEGILVTARQVGRIMWDCPDGVPWYRVVGAGGHLPIGKRDPRMALIQRHFLETEGVAFLENGCVDMLVHQWRPDAEPP